MYLALSLWAATMAVLLLLGAKILMNLDQLKAEVAQDKDVMSAAAKLLGGLATQLAAYKNEPDQIQALADTLVNGRTELSAAIVQGTPAAPSGPDTNTAGGDTANNTAAGGGQSADSVQA